MRGEVLQPARQATSPHRPVRQETEGYPRDMLGDQRILARRMHANRDIRFLVEKIGTGIAENQFEIEFRVTLAKQLQ